MKRSSSGTRTPKPAVFVLGFLFILVGIFGILYNPSNSLTETLTWKVSEAGILSFSEREGSVFTIQKKLKIFILLKTRIL